TCITTGVQLFFQGKLKRELLNCPIKRGGAWLALSAYSTSLLPVCLIQDFRFDDFFNHIFQGDNSQNFIKRVSFPFIVHSLHNGQGQLKTNLLTIVLTEAHQSHECNGGGSKRRQSYSVLPKDRTVLRTPPSYTAEALQNIPSSTDELILLFITTTRTFPSVSSVCTKLWSKEHVIEVLCKAKCKVPGHQKIHISEKHGSREAAHMGSNISPAVAPGRGADPVSLTACTHSVQLGVIENKVQGVVVKFGDGFQGSTIIWIHEGQVFDKEQVHDVGTLSFEHWDSSVATLHDFGHSVEVQDSLAGDHEAVPEGSHHILYSLGAELQRPLDDVQLLLNEVVIGVSDPEHLQQFFPVIDSAYLLAQDAVQQFAHRVRSREGHHHEKLGEEDGVGPYGQAVSGADGLGHYFPEDDDANGRDHHRHKARARNVVEQDGERGVDQHVAQQQRAQQVVALPAHRLDALGFCTMRSSIGSRAMSPRLRPLNMPDRHRSSEMKITCSQKGSRNFFSSPTIILVSSPSW
ncbi:hypothetical protein A6R68_01917, partial [Neotoma lepida]